MKNGFSISGLLLVTVIIGSAAEPDPRARVKIEALEKVLPEAEKAADACEKALAPMLESTDATVRTAVDAARLRIDCVRSVRTIIRMAPDYLINHIAEADLRKWQEGMDYYLACARSGTDPFKGMVSGVRTCRSKVDGQLLFYVLRLPKDYDPARRYSLEVSLHAGAGLTWRAGWVDGKPSADPARAEKEPRIWMSPCGRGNNCYAAMGEVAVMDALHDVKRHYAVDPDRVTIGGASMGGTGGFRLAALHPDAFAAAYSLTGGANYALPVGDGRFDATLLVDNFCNTGMCIWDAPKEGWYKQNHAFAEGLRERARKFAGSYRHIELTDPAGGHGIIDRKLQAEGRDWLAQQVRNPWPKRVVYKTYNLRYTGAFWAHIDTMEDGAQPARIEAELSDGGKLRVAVENTDRFHLNLARELVGELREVQVSINGSAALQVAPGPHVHFAKSGDRWATAPDGPRGLVKKHGVSGPVQDVFMEQPALIVYGSRAGQDAAAQQKMIDAAVQQLFGPGDGAATLHTSFERRADAKVSERDVAEKNLVLFGTPKDNDLVRRIADRLPVKFLDDGVEVAGRAYRGNDVGLVLVYPNPLNPERYVLLLPEQYAGGSPMRLPDYQVVRLKTTDRGPYHQVLAQGVFNSRWQLAGDKAR
jgi:pimeloyl-ACP methyl ester carboxylesterase